MEEAVKTCTVCGVVKPLTAFNVHKNNKTDGRRGACKSCYQARNRQLRKENGDRVRSREQEWRDANRHHVRDSANRRRRANSEKTIWSHMIYRCYDSMNTSYPRYGARGIRVCARWRKSFKNFYEDMGARPSPQHSLDRIDNDGNYTKENCRWATAKEQMRNTGDNRMLSAFGETLPMVVWAERLGIEKGTLYRRLKRGWPVERAVSEPLQARFSRNPETRMACR